MPSPRNIDVNCRLVLRFVGYQAFGLGLPSAQPLDCFPQVAVAVVVAAAVATAVAVVVAAAVATGLQSLMKDRQL